MGRAARAKESRGNPTREDETSRATRGMLATLHDKCFKDRRVTAARLEFSDRRRVRPGTDHARRTP